MPFETQRGIARRQNGHSDGGRRKLGQGTEAACLGRSRALNTARAMLSKERGGWWMGRWPPHPLRIRASLVGRLISGGLRSVVQQSHRKRASWGFHLRLWSFHFTDEPAQLTGHRCFVYNQRSSLRSAMTFPCL